MLKKWRWNISTSRSQLKGIVAVIVDFNLDRLKRYQRKRKLFRDLEAEHGLECLITKPTRIAKKRTISTSTLIDVLLTNRPDLFKTCGVYNAALTNNKLVYGLKKEKVNRNSKKVITFRSYKNCDLDKFLLSPTWIMKALQKCQSRQVRFTIVNFVYFFLTIVKAFYNTKLSSVTSAILRVLA